MKKLGVPMIISVVLSLFITVITVPEGTTLGLQIGTWACFCSTDIHGCGCCPVCGVTVKIRHVRQLTTAFWIIGMVAIACASIAALLPARTVIARTAEFQCFDNKGWSGVRQPWNQDDCARNGAEQRYVFTFEYVEDRTVFSCESSAKFFLEDFEQGMVYKIVRPIIFNLDNCGTISKSEDTPR